METYTRQMQAGERAAMKRWLRKHGHRICDMSSDPTATERLMKQVQSAGGNPHELMRQGREKVKSYACMCHQGSTCTVSHDPSCCDCQQCREAEARS